MRGGGGQLSEQAGTDISSQVERLPAAIPQPEHSEYRVQARRWLAAAGPDSALPQRMVVTRGYVRLLAAGVWGADESWRADVRELVVGLRPTEEQDASGEQLALVAIGMALLLQEANLHGGAGPDQIARSAWELVQEWVAYAEESDITAELVTSTQLHARVATGSEVQAVVELAMAAADDPRAEIIAALETEGYHAEYMEGVWVIDGDFRTPLRAAARAATLIASPCVVLARNTKKSTVLLWRDTVLAMAESTVPRWRIYRIVPPTTPQSKFGGGDGLPTTRDIHPLAPAPEQVRTLAEQAGVTLPMLLAALR
ncbi:hypothetical protein [Actinocrispum wychmicini]|uniref:hypothetical protein n=1 Tax=Actinocrispum wychmicini TaxID=1213861 RepID=UPI00104B3DC7|nr:hypothetical protein [Actinocrispum wychmicini]